MTDYKVFLNETAEYEINEIAIWCEIRSTDLGFRFLECFENLMFQISQNPFAHILAFDNFRRAFMISFPYLIFYSVDDDHKEVEILGVYHTSRNPKETKRKLKN